MTAVVKCPQCELQLALPDNAARESLARCPVCRQAFALKDVDIVPVLPLIVLPAEQEAGEAGEESGGTDDSDEASPQSLATPPDLEVTPDVAGDECALMLPASETSGAAAEPSRLRDATEEPHVPFHAQETIAEFSPTATLDGETIVPDAPDSNTIDEFVVSDASDVMSALSSSFVEVEHVADDGSDGTESLTEQAEEEQAVVGPHADEPDSAHPDEYLDDPQSTYEVESHDVAESADAEYESDPPQSDDGLEYENAEETTAADHLAVAEEHIELEPPPGVDALGDDYEFDDGEIEVAEATAEVPDVGPQSQAETIEFSDDVATGDITWQETELGTAAEAEPATTPDTPGFGDAADASDSLVAEIEAGQTDELELSRKADTGRGVDGREHSDVVDLPDQLAEDQRLAAGDEPTESDSTSRAMVTAERDSKPRPKKKGRATDWELLAANAARNRGPGVPLWRIATGVGIGAVLLVAGYSALVMRGGPSADILGVTKLWRGAEESPLESGTSLATADRDGVVQANAVEEPVSSTPAPFQPTGGSPALVAPAEFVEDVDSVTASGPETTTEADLTVGRYGERYSPDATAAAPPAVNPPQPTRYVEVAAELNDVPKYEFEHLMAAHSAAQATRKDLLGPEVPDNLKAIAYARSCDLSQALTFLEGVQQLSGDPGRAEAAMLRLEAKDFFRKALLDKSAWPEVGRLSTAWIRSPYRPHGGIFLVGRRLKGRKRGSVFEYPVDTGFGDPVIVLTEGSLSKTVYPPGGYMAVVGSVIESPAEQVSGYDGEAKPVVWSGFTIPLQTTQSNGVQPVFRVF